MSNVTTLRPERDTGVQHNLCSQNGSPAAINPFFFNYQAEVEVLGSIFTNNHSLCDIIGYIRYDDFYDARHKLIYKAMVELYRNSAPIDVATVYHSLGSVAADLGGIAYLSQICGACCTALKIKAHADIVKEKSQLRALNILFNNFMEKLHGGGSSGCNISSSQLVSDLLGSLLKFEDSSSGEDGKVTPHMEKYISRLEARCQSGGEIQGIKTGYPRLDRVTGGFNPGDYIILAARPSMGKSALSMNMAWNTVLNEGKKAAFFNLEMSIEQTLGRSLASNSLVAMDSLKTGKLADEEWQVILSKADRLCNDSMRIFEKQSTLNDIWAECKKLKLRSGLDIVFIDYLQLIKSGGRYENRNMDITNISRSLKLMAMELDITVVALSQLSRAPETRRDHRPMLSDLRDSGSIEQDADIVMLLYRDLYYDADTKEPDIIECIIAKNRNGEVGTVKLKWVPKFQKVV